MFLTCQGSAQLVAGFLDLRLFKRQLGVCK